MTEEFKFSIHPDDRRDQRITALEARVAAGEARIAELECALSRAANNLARVLHHE